MEWNKIRTILATQDHLISGTLAGQGRRLLDLLEDPNKSYLTVEQVQIFRREGLSSVATMASCLLAKSSVAVAVVTGAEHEAPKKRIDTFVPKRRYSALVIAQGYEVRGNLYLRGSGDAAHILHNELGPFFPVAQSVLSFAGAELSQEPNQVVLINRQHVSLLHVAPPVDTVAPPVDTVAPPVDTPVGLSLAGKEPAALEEPSAAL